jgi:Glyoxalase-like domain
VAELWVDHVICAVGDLDAAAARFWEEFGLRSVAGGVHQGWGTANRIVPLGQEYVELVTVVDREQAAASDFGRVVLDAVANGQQLLGWVVATDDLESIAGRLNLDVTRGSRTRPDGSTLSWRVAGLAAALSTGALPFFIQWDGPPALHPGAAVVEHAVSRSRIAWIELAAERGTVNAWLCEHDLPVRITDGRQALSAVGITTADGEVVLR